MNRSDCRAWASAESRLPAFSSWIEPLTRLIQAFWLRHLSVSDSHSGMAVSTTPNAESMAAGRFTVLSGLVA
ncbi:MAG: hypothetical protein B7Z72_11065 [Gemmatimonadetes bacterium 21-71-4]|nr:MAG: hypothetical protein B7Z72_11065 [Gemmatimonadetes bacterium 21-71-4]